MQYGEEFEAADLSLVFQGKRVLIYSLVSCLTTVPLHNLFTHILHSAIDPLPLQHNMVKDSSKCIGMPICSKQSICVFYSKHAHFLSHCVKRASYSFFYFYFYFFTPCLFSHY